jgi:hypothetical protein
MYLKNTTYISQNTYIPPSYIYTLPIAPLIPVPLSDSLAVSPLATPIHAPPAHRSIPNVEYHLPHLIGQHA